MAGARAKKKAGGARPSAWPQVLVVLEDMQSHFKVFGEGLQSFREQVDRRFDQVDGRLDKVEGRLDRVEGQLDKVEGRLDRVEHEIVLLKDVGVENTRGLKEVRSAVDRLMVLRAFPFRG